MNDTLGNRMKSQYENRTRFYLPRRTYTILRVDGKAFHTYTEGLEDWVDPLIYKAMTETARFLCQEIQGAKFGYTQSDEISILLTDFDNINTEAWFDGNIQKMVSVAASLATGHFEQMGPVKGKVAAFDARVFTIPDRTEVENYFIWRQQDATRNSIQSFGRSYFSHKELVNLSCDKIQEKVFQEKGVNWNDLEPFMKRGTGLLKNGGVWSIDKAVPIFTQDRGYLRTEIPIYE